MTPLKKIFKRKLLHENRKDKQQSFYSILVGKLKLSRYIDNLFRKQNLLPMIIPFLKKFILSLMIHDLSQNVK